MSTQTRNSGGGGRNQKKINSGGGGDSATHVSKKTDSSKTEKEKPQPKPTAEQLRIAQITNTNASEDPQMREKVATLIETTQRSEEEVCCALHECDYNLEHAVVFLLETLPVGAFETSSKKKKSKAEKAAQDAGGDADWDTNANTDKREKSRNRSSNRGGRGGTDSRGWRGRETRENEKNMRDSRVSNRGGDRENNYRNSNTEGNDRPRNRTFNRGGRGGGSYSRGGGRGSGGGRGDRGGYNRRDNNEDHQEVELWDNTIAQNADKLNQSQDDAWGDWDNEEYVGSLKDSKVFTTSNLQNQSVASVVSSGVGGGLGSSDISAPPGMEHHLSSSVQTQQQHLGGLLGVGGSSADENSSVAAQQASVATAVPGNSAPMTMQYSAAVSSTPAQQQQHLVSGRTLFSEAGKIDDTGKQAQTQQQSQMQHQQPASYSAATVDSFSNAATAAANMVQQHQQSAVTHLKSSATLSAEQSQYFNSLTSQNAAAAAGVQSVQAFGGQSAVNVQFTPSYANVFAGSATATGVGAAGDQSQLSNSAQQPQVRRARAKLPPPSKIPSTAVEMPGDALNSTGGYIDVQFGALDFGTEDSFEALPDKFNAAVNLDSQQQQHLVQNQQDSVSDYQGNKSSVQQLQTALTAGLQSAQLTDALTSGYAQRTATQGSTVSPGVPGVSAVGNTNSNALDQIAKNDPYSQSNASSSAAAVAAAYQSTYQTNASIATNKGTTNPYQQSSGVQGYNSSNYSSVANSYQPQSYAYNQQNSVNSYQQQGAGNAQNSSNSVGGSTSTQNIPVGGTNNSVTANPNNNYLTGYSTQPNAYQSSQSVYGSNTGFAGSSSTSSSQYSNFSASAKLKDSSNTSSASHFDSVSGSNNAVSSTGTSVNSVSSSVNAASTTGNSMASSTLVGALINSKVAHSSSTSNAGSGGSGIVNSNASNAGGNSSSTASSSGVASSNNNSTSNSGGVNSSAVSGASISSSGGGAGGNNNASSVVAAAAAMSSSSSNKNTTGSGGMVPNIQMVSQYIQTGLPYYQQPVYSYEDIQMMQQRVPHVQGYYDLNYTPTSLGAGRDNLGSVAYSAMTDGRFTRTDNNSSPVSNVSSTMSQQAGSGGPMLNVPYAYFYGGMPGSFQYGTPAIYPQQQIPAANTASGGQFPKPSYNTGYGSTSYDALSQATQDYTKGAYQSSVNQQTKSQNVTTAPPGTGSDISSSMYGKTHVTLNKVNSYKEQNFHSGTPPPFNMPTTQTAGGSSAQPYGMYLPMPAAGHHNMMHPPIHQMDGRIHYSSSRGDSNSTAQRQQTSSQSKTATKQGYSPSYWPGQN